MRIAKIEALWCAAVAVAAYRGVAIIQVAGGGDFGSYAFQGFRQSIYYPARAYLDGLNPYDTLAYTRAYSVPFFPFYSPLTLLVHAPFALLSFPHACVLYYGVTLALTLVLAALTARWCRLEARGATLCTIAALMVLSRPGQMNLLLGQSALQLVIAAYVALECARTRPWLAGIGLAFTTLKPTLGIPLAILMMCRRDWWAVAIGVVTALIATTVVTVQLVHAAGTAGVFLTSVATTYATTAVDPAVNLTSNWARLDAIALIGHLLDREIGATTEFILTAALLSAGGFALARLCRDDMNDMNERHLHSNALICLTVLTSTYHQAYDALLLAGPLALLVSGRWRLLRSLDANVVLTLLLAVPAINYLASDSAVRVLGMSAGLRRAVTAINPAALLLAWGIQLVRTLRVRSARFGSVTI